MKREKEIEIEEAFEMSGNSSALELWFLATLFTVVVGGLVHLQRHQQAAHSEVAKQVDPTGIQSHAEFTRNKTPALGL